MVEGKTLGLAEEVRPQCGNPPPHAMSNTTMRPRPHHNRLVQVNVGCWSMTAEHTGRDAWRGRTEI